MIKPYFNKWNGNRPCANLGKINDVHVSTKYFCTKMKKWRYSLISLVYDNRTSRQMSHDILKQFGVCSGKLRYCISPPLTFPFCSLQLALVKWPGGRRLSPLCTWLVRDLWRVNTTWPYPLTNSCMSCPSPTSTSQLVFSQSSTEQWIRRLKVRHVSEWMYYICKCQIDGFNAV